MLAAAAPARLIAIFDWEMATIGDPLADIGYMMIHWRQAGEEAARFALQSVTTLPGFPDATGADRALRGALRALDARARLVRDAGALEGGRVHGGQLQARDHRARPTTLT